MSGNDPHTGHAREMGQFEATLTGFGRTLTEMREENRVARRDQSERSERFFDLHEQTRQSISETNESVAVLVESIKNEKEHTNTRFAGIWRWLLILGGGGAAGTIGHGAYTVVGG